MSLHDISTIGLVSSHTTVVWTCVNELTVKQTIQALIRAYMHPSNYLLTLWSRETIRRPAERVSVCAQDGVLLLHAEPRMLVLHHFHNFFTCDAKVGFCRNETQIRRRRPGKSTAVRCNDLRIALTIVRCPQKTNTVTNHTRWASEAKKKCSHDLKLCAYGSFLS